MHRYPLFQMMIVPITICQSDETQEFCLMVFSLFSEQACVSFFVVWY